MMLQFAVRLGMPRGEKPGGRLFPVGPGSLKLIVNLLMNEITELKKMFTEQCAKVKKKFVDL